MAPTRSHNAMIRLVMVLMLSVGAGLPEALADQVEAGTATSADDIDTWLQVTYIDALSDHPEDNTLRTRLLRVLVGLRRYDDAIATGLDFLMDDAGDAGQAQNHLGIAYYLKGETRQAAYYFRLALQARPQDDGIQRNLEQALWELGRAEGVSRTAAPSTDGEQRGAAGMVDDTGFYWIDD